MMDEQRKRQIRWRLVLGRGAEGVLGSALDSETLLAQEQALEFLYDREYGEGRNVRGADGRQGGSGDSQLTVPEWINAVHELFPQKTIERIEKDALERYKLEEMVTNPEILRKAQPSETLLKAVMRTKHLMNQEVLALARRLMQQVVEELMKKLAREVNNAFTGALNRQQRSYLKIAKNFDAKTTIRRNLGNIDPKTGKMFIKTPYFHSRIRRQADKWQIIILVDQSGSMVENVIHSAVMASIFWGIKSLRTHLIVFDTNVVDLTQDCQDPVETLMKVQLGGGTNIAKAMQYAETLVDYPQRTIVVLVTDFYEGGSVQSLLGTTFRLTESGVHVLGLAALDRGANPAYDKHTAGRMVEMGAQVGAMTPGELALWVAEKVR